MADLIVLALVALLVGGAVAYLVRAKRRGVKCIGCSACSSKSHHSQGCSGSCSGGCSGCHHEH